MPQDDEKPVRSMPIDRLFAIGTAPGSVYDKDASIQPLFVEASRYEREAEQARENAQNAAKRAETESRRVADLISLRDKVLASIERLES